MRSITLLLLVAACEYPRPADVPGDDAAASDAGVDALIDAGFDAPPVAPGEWGLPEYVLNVNTPDRHETMPSVSADKQELHFVRFNAPENNFDIFVAVRASPLLWALPIRVKGMDEDLNKTEYNPELAPNGREIFLDGIDRPQISRSTRNSPSDPWTSPRLAWIDGGISPSLTGDGLTIYYAAGGIKRRTRATLADEWGDEQDVVEPRYSSVSVTPDDLHMVLSSGGTGLPPVAELSRASVADPWGTLTEIPSLSALVHAPMGCDLVDENTMYCSMTDGTDYDIYMVRRMPK